MGNIRQDWVGLWKKGQGIARREIPEKLGITLAQWVCLRYIMTHGSEAEIGLLSNRTIYQVRQRIYSRLGTPSVDEPTHNALYWAKLAVCNLEQIDGAERKPALAYVRRWMNEHA